MGHHVLTDEQGWSRTPRRDPEGAGITGSIRTCIEVNTPPLPTIGSDAWGRTKVPTIGHGLNPQLWGHCHRCVNVRADELPPQRDTAHVIEGLPLNVTKNVDNVFRAVSSVARGYTTNPSLAPKYGSELGPRRRAKDGRLDQGQDGNLIHGGFLSIRRGVERPGDKAGTVNVTTA